MTERHQVGIFQSLLQNPNLRLEHLTHFSGPRPDFRLTGEYQEAAFFQLFLHAVSNLSRPGSAEVSVAVLERYAAYGGSLCSRGPAQHAPTRLVKVITALPAQAPLIYDAFVSFVQQMRMVLEGFDNHDPHVPEIIVRLDAGLLSRVILSRPELIPVVRDLLLNALGQDPAVWETFNTLGQDNGQPVIASAVAAAHLHR
jgi:hypothetical protein